MRKHNFVRRYTKRGIVASLPDSFFTLKTNGDLRRAKPWNLFDLAFIRVAPATEMEAKVIVPAGLAFSNVMVGAVVVAILYFAREILVPIALAVLLSFVLAPLVRALQRLRFPRTLAVIGAVGTAFIITFSLATMVMVEVNQLASDLPSYENTLSEKIRNVRDAVVRSGLLANASNLLKDLDQELKTKSQNESPVTRPSLQDGARKARHPFRWKCISLIRRLRRH